MISIGLKDAYLSVPVAQEDRFGWKEVLYEFQCLPFGLSSAPRVFTKLLKPVVSFLRGRGIRCILFLDDMLVMDHTKQELQKATHKIVLQILEFRINWEKSVLNPTQVIQHLGLVVASASGRLWSMDECQSHINTLEMLGVAVASPNYKRDKAVSHTWDHYPKNGSLEHSLKITFVWYRYKVL